MSIDVKSFMILRMTRMIEIINSNLSTEVPSENNNIAKANFYI